MAGGRPLRIDWQDTDTVATLELAYRKAADPHVARRLQALWSLRQGDGIRETARTLGLSERSLQLWVAWYRDGGLAAVGAHRLTGPGRTARLSATQQTALCDQLGAGAVHTAVDTVAWVQAQFQVSYRPKGMYSLLARLRSRPKVPRP